MQYPHWLKKHTPKTLHNKAVRKIIADDSVHTVCESALCPNRGECFSNKTMTFMILGKVCTRNCRFCAVDSVGNKEILSIPNTETPQKVAAAARKLELSHVVITSVTRDDLSDGGAEQFAETITAVRQSLPDSTIEVLTPDFQGNIKALNLIFSAKPDVFNHNVETVASLYSEIRPEADLERSLLILKYAKEKSSCLVKTGFMVGLGETEKEILVLLGMIKQAGADIVTIGQYLAPSKKHAPVKEFIHPEKFAEYKNYGEKHLGIPQVLSGPFVRSSYLAKETLAKHFTPA